jgi:cell wall-associated NlpC family hydrolase
MIGVQGVMSRISELKTQLGIAPTTTGTTGTTTATGTSTASGTSFANALAGATPGPASPGVTGQAVVDSAKKYLGTKYVFGSTDPAKGLDCSALVQRAYQDLGIDLPRNSKQQAQAGTKVNGLADAKPGDILAFDKPVDHVAIYVGNNKMIAAPKPGDHVKIQSPGRTAPRGPPLSARPACRTPVRSRVCRTPTCSSRRVRSTASPPSFSPPWRRSSRATTRKRSARSAPRG